MTRLLSILLLALAALTAHGQSILLPWTGQFNAKTGMLQWQQDTNKLASVKLSTVDGYQFKSEADGTLLLSGYVTFYPRPWPTNAYVSLGAGGTSVNGPYNEATAYGPLLNDMAELMFSTLVPVTVGDTFFIRAYVVRQPEPPWFISGNLKITRLVALTTTTKSPARPQARLITSTTNAVAYIAARNTHYELKPETVPLPTGGVQWVTPMRRIVSLATSCTNHPVTVTLTAPAPYAVEVSTNLLAWTYFDESTNTVWTFDVCPEQQAQIPVAFFRSKPLSNVTRTFRIIQP